MAKIKKTEIPKNLTSWQKKYGPGFVLYSLKTGRPLLADRDYMKLMKKAEKKDIVQREKTSVVYVPSTKQISTF